MLTSICERRETTWRDLRAYRSESMASTRRLPSSHGRSGFTTIRTAAHLSHNRRGFPATVFLLSRGVLGAAATGSACRRFPSSQTCLARRHYSTRYHGGWVLTRAAGSRPFGCRPARAGTNRRTAQSCARPTNRYQETPFIVIRKHRSTSRRRRRHYCTISSRAALWGISRHADRLGTAGMGRNTCANQRPHLLLQSSAF